MHRRPKILRSIGLPIIPTNPNANAWNTPHDLPIMSDLGVNGNMNSPTHNDYNVVPPSSGVVNNTNTLFVQLQLPMTNATAIGGPMHNYPSQTI